ncbi:MAG: hypothetical protein ACLT74_02345 [Christensenellales bacterium]
MAEQLVQCYQAIETFADALLHQPDAVIAYTGPMEQQLLLRAIPAFRAHHPEVELRAAAIDGANQHGAEAGDCDIALAIPGEIPLQQMKHVTVMERPSAPPSRRRTRWRGKFRHSAGADAFSCPPAGGRESQGEQPNRPLADGLVDKGRAALCGYRISC